MTIRKRVKHKWHFTLGDFEFKKATYHPAGKKSFEVWYKNDFIGDCIVPFYRSKNNIQKLEIFSKEDSGTKYSAYDFANGGKQPIGNVFCIGLRSNFPTTIIKAELFADKSDMVSIRKILFEKYPEKLKFVTLDVILRELNHGELF